MSRLGGANVWRVFAVCVAVGCGGLQASEPSGPTSGKPVVIAPDDGISGDGSADRPYVFPTGAKGKLKASGPVTAWKVDCCPPNTDVIKSEHVIYFATDRPAKYVVMAIAGEKEIVAAWFVIHSGPAPPLAEVDTLAVDLKAALVGPDASTDAKKLLAMSEGVRQDLAAGKYKTLGDVVAAWKRVQSAVNWPGGKYPTMPDLIRRVIPAGDPATELTEVTRSKMVAGLRTIETVCEKL